MSLTFTNHYCNLNWKQATFWGVDASYHLQKIPTWDSWLLEVSNLYIHKELACLLFSNVPSYNIESFFCSFPPTKPLFGPCYVPFLISQLFFKFRPSHHPWTHQYYLIFIFLFVLRFFQHVNMISHPNSSSKLLNPIIYAWILDKQL